MNEFFDGLIAFIPSDPLEGRTLYFHRFSAMGIAVSTRFASANHLTTQSDSTEFVEVLRRGRPSHLGRRPGLLRGRLEADGYLYLKRFFPRQEVLEVRKSILARMRDLDLILPTSAVLDAIANPARRTVFMPELAENNRALESLIYGNKLRVGLATRKVARFAEINLPLITQLRKGSDLGPRHPYLIEPAISPLI